LSQLRKEISL